MMKSLYKKCVVGVPKNSLNKKLFSNAVNALLHSVKEDRIHLNFNGLAMSPTLGLNEMQNLLQDDGRDVYKFGFGQSPMPIPSCMVKGLEKYAAKKEYLPVQGLLGLRQSIATHFNNKSNWDNISADDIVITPGTKQALFLIKLVLSQNCEILLPSPSWVSYQPQAQLLSKAPNVRWVDTNIHSNWKIDPQMFEDKYLKNEPFKQRFMVFNTPANPTSVTYNASELEQLAHLCRKYNVIVLSDEIYGELYHDERNGDYYSIREFYPEGTIISNGLSKSLGAGGWRLGYVIFPKQLQWLLNAVFVASSETHTSVCAPVQYASMAAFDQGNADEISNYLKIKRKILRGLANESYNKLSNIPGCNVLRPDGGFYIFPDFSNVHNIQNMVQKWSKTQFRSSHEWNAKEFALFLLKESGVAGLSGCCFGRPINELTMRLSYVDFDGSHILSNIDSNYLDNIEVDSKEMKDLLLKYCPQTMKGMSALHDYMTSL